MTDPDALRKALAVLRDMGDDLADALVAGVDRPDDISEADWDAGGEALRAALDRSEPAGLREVRANFAARIERSIGGTERIMQMFDWAVDEVRDDARRLAATPTASPRATGERDTP